MQIASIDGGDLSKVWDIKTLGLVRDGEARKLLEDVAKQVQPIMRKRKWKVLLLSEFCPRNPSLLGLNIDGGREIRIRLRRHPSDPQFFPYEDLLATMLHELAHMQCGPHDAAFYALLDKLKAECEDLMIKGIKGTGQGFDARGQRLGGFRRNPPPTSVRQIALAAAEKRARAGATMPAGPHRLGGDSEIMRALSPIQAAAMAAERRLRDDLWCAAPVTSGEDGLSKAREREEASVPDDSDARKRSTESATKGNQSSRDNSPSLSSAGRNAPRTVGVDISNLGRLGAGVSSSGMGQGKQPEQMQREGGGSSEKGSQSNPICIDNSHGDTSRENGDWCCHVCTLLNNSSIGVCEVCATPRLNLAEDNSKSWTCKFCTLKNNDVMTNCGACDQWRFSYGAPIARPGPYVGT